MSGIVLITPTRDRPLAFALCEEYMGRQTCKDFTWLVVDDGDEPIVPKWKQSPLFYLRRSPSAAESTLPENLLAALESPLLARPEGQLVLVIEDDEWYHPTYVETLTQALRSRARGFVGQCDARYYHIIHRTHNRPVNRQHASLCRTGWVHGRAERAWFLACVEASLRAGDPFVDMRVWERNPLPGAGKLDAPELHLLRGVPHLSVGIKGMPGRGGLGTAHRAGHRWQKDRTGLLEEWTTREDAARYHTIARESRGKGNPIAQARGEAREIRDSLRTPQAPPDASGSPRRGRGESR